MGFWTLLIEVHGLWMWVGGLAGHDWIGIGNGRE